MQKIYLAALLSMGFFTVSNAQITSEAELQSQMMVPTYGIGEIFEAGDTLYPPDTTTQEGKKAYYRWRYRIEGRNTYPGVTRSSTVYDLANYLLTTDYYTFCNQGPSSAPWTEVGPDPQPGDRQAIGLISTVVADPNNHNTIYVGTVESGIYKTTDGGTTWINMLENTSLGTMAGLGIAHIEMDPNDPNTLLVGVITHSFNIPSDWAGTKKGFGVLKTTDGGQSWSVGEWIGGNDDYWYVQKIMYHPTNSNIAVAIGNKTIYKTTNGGDDWNLVYTNPTQERSIFIDIEYNLSNPNIVMASTRLIGEGLLNVSNHAAQVFSSTNSGNLGSWNEVILPTPTQSDSGWAAGIAMDVSPADPSQVYLLYTNYWGLQSNNRWHDYEHNHLLKTPDGGQSWVLVMDTVMKNFANPYSLMAYRFNGGFREFELSDHDPATLYIGGFKFAKSINSGATYDHGPYRYAPPDQFTHGDVRDIHNLGYINGEDQFLIANDGGLSKTENSGQSFSNLNGTGLGIAQFFGFDVYRGFDERLIGGAIHNGISVKRPQGWLLFRHGGDGDWSEIDHLAGEEEDTTYGVINGDFEIFIHQGAIEVNDTLYARQPSGLYFYRGQKLMMDPANHNRVYHLAKDINRYDRRSNSWVTYFNAPSNRDANSGVSALAFAPSDLDRAYVAYQGISWGDPISQRFFRTSNGGSSWLDITDRITYNNSTTIYTWTWISDIVVDPQDANHLFVSIKNYGKDGANPSQGKFRVMESTDAGNTWTDISTGLKPIPVNDLEYIEGTDDLIFAATDAGVYYWDKPNQTWQCFSNSLPNAIAINLEHNRCTQELYVSTQGRGIWKVDMKGWLRPQHHIYDYTVWDYDRFMDGDIIVHPNAELYISAKIHLGHDARILIEPNGRLVLKNKGILTSGNCNENWSGIWMEGQSSQPQQTAYQPKLILEPGSVIEYAEQAINTTAPPTGSNWVVWGTQGGIIDAEGAVFRNNTRDVNLLSYTSPTNQAYKASFKNCEFERDSNYRNPSLMAHISMMGVEGVLLQGNRFNFDISNQPAFKDNGEGIYALNATFICDRSSTNNASFSGYRDAIRARNVLCANTARPIEINRTVFNDNTHSIYLSEAQYAKVSHNSVHVPNVAVHTHINAPAVFQPALYGIYMDGCQDFQLYENVLFTDGQNGAIETTGLIIKNSGPVATEVYRNIIDGFTVGLEAIGRNRDAGLTDVGLRLKCNDIGYVKGNEYDVFIAQANSHPENGIQVFQGKPNIFSGAELPNNLFTPNGKPFTSNFQNEENSSVAYYYGQGNIRLEPLQAVGILKSGLSEAVDMTTHCQPRPLAPPSNITTLNQELSQAETDLGNDLGLRAQYIDEGATPQLEAQILFASSQQEYQDLYIDLMEIAPYVSDENLMNVAQIEDYPELALRNIMVANPHASRNPEIMEILYLKEPPLSQQTLDDIEAGEQTITAKDVLDMDIMEAQARSEAATLQILAYYREQEQYGSIKPHLLSRDEPHFHYSLVDYHLSRAELAEAQQVLDDLPTKCVMEDQDWLDYQEMTEYYDVVKYLDLSDPEALGGEAATTLNTIAAYEGDGPASGRARNTLAHYGQPTTYFEPVYMPGGQGKKASDPQPERPESAISGFSLSPNPSEGHVILRWDWLNSGLNEGEITIRVYDLKGALRVEKSASAQNNTQLINMEALPEGAYLVQVYQENRLLHKEKLIKE